MKGEGSKKVLFVHGLESGPTGSKARYLLSHFDSDYVIVPDMQMSVFDIQKENSVVRNFFSFSASMQGCVHSILRRIQAEKLSGDDFILVGSSWGGAVALNLLVEHNIRPYKTILLAPALKVTGWMSFFFPNYIPKQIPVQIKNIIVIHGVNDDTVPIQSSRDLSILYPDIVELMEVENGDHRLNDYLLTSSTEYPSGRLCSMLKSYGVKVKAKT